MENNRKGIFSGLAIAFLILSFHSVFSSTESDCQSSHMGIEAKICNDPILLDDDNWLTHLYNAALKNANTPDQKRLISAQQAWIRQRDKDCETPNNVRDGDPVSVCLDYADRTLISVFEMPLRQFRDLNEDVPGSHDVCTAVDEMVKTNKWRWLDIHALHEKNVGRTTWDLANDENDGGNTDKSTSAGNTKARNVSSGISKYLSMNALAEADDADMGDNAEFNYFISRIPLYENKPDAWIFSAYVGTSYSPNIYIFVSTADGKMGDHFIGHLGFEASGPFKTSYIRFKRVPYALLQYDNEDGSYSAEIYSINPVKKECSVSKDD